MGPVRRTERKLLAILAADVVGYSLMMGRDEAGTLARLKELRADVFDPAVKEHNGHVFKLIGDGSLVAFQSVVDAVSCALAIQLSLRSSPNACHEGIRLRIGVNLGDVIIDGDDIYGEGVNIAARLETLSDPGGVLVSGTVFDHVSHKLALDFEPLGEQHLKNISDPVKVYRIQLEGAPRPGRRLRRPVGVVVAGLPAVFLAALTGLFALYSSLLSYQRAPALATKPSIAVLPFASQMGDPQQDYLADGITADIITDLSKVSGLMVIARNSAFAFRSEKADPNEVAAQLKVRYVLVGNIRRVGDRLKVNVELVDSETRSNVWAERYDDPYDDLFGLQDRLVRNVVSTLAVRLTDSERTDIGRLPTRNLEAYDFYTRAEQKAYSTGYKSLKEVLALYERAISLDPGFADAYAGYARATVDVLGMDLQALMLSAVARQRAYEAAGRALEINPRTSRAYAVLGILQLLDRQFDKAVESVRTAQRLDPNGADAKLNLAIVLAYAGQSAEALTSMNELLKLDPRPRPQVSAYRAFVLVMNRRFDDAVSELEAVRPEELDDFAIETLVTAYVGAGRIGEARRTASLILARNPFENLAGLKVLYSNHRRDEDLEFRLQAWREAGIPEWPHGFSGLPENRLDPETLRSITGDRMWRGQEQGGTPLIMQLSKNGSFAQRGQSGMISGRYSIDADLFCTKSEAVLLGRVFCSPVFKNVDATRSSAYVYADYANVWYFDAAD